MNQSHASPAWVWPPLKCWRLRALQCEAGKWKQPLMDCVTPHLYSSVLVLTPTMLFTSANSERGSTLLCFKCVGLAFPCSTRLWCWCRWGSTPVTFWRPVHLLGAQAAPAPWLCEGCVQGSLRWWAGRQHCADGCSRQPGRAGELSRTLAPSRHQTPCAFGSLWHQCCYPPRWRRGTKHKGAPLVFVHIHALATLRAQACASNVHQRATWME